MQFQIGGRYGRKCNQEFMNFTGGPTFPENSCELVAVIYKHRICLSLKLYMNLYSNPTFCHKHLLEPNLLFL